MEQAGCKYIGGKSGKYYLTWHYCVNIPHIEIATNGSVLNVLQWEQNLTDYWISLLTHSCDLTKLTWLGFNSSLLFTWPGTWLDLTLTWCRWRWTSRNSWAEWHFLADDDVSYMFNSYTSVMSWSCHGQRWCHVMVLAMCFWNFKKQILVLFCNLVDRDELGCLLFIQRFAPEVPITC